MKIKYHPYDTRMKQRVTSTKNYKQYEHTFTCAYIHTYIHTVGGTKADVSNTSEKVEQC